MSNDSGGAILAAGSPGEIQNSVKPPAENMQATFIRPVETET
ncbi:hypothetical protein [Methylomonas sp. HYX-M1]